MHCVSGFDVTNEALNLLQLLRESVSYPTTVFYISIYTYHVPYLHGCMMM
jgi:hypothetical protein